MTITNVARINLLLLAFLCSALPTVASNVNLAADARTAASSTMGNSKVAAVADGVVSDESRWLAANGDAAPWVELSFPKPVKIGAIDIYSGYKNEGALDAFDLTLEVNGQSVSPAAGKVRDNRETARRVEVEFQNVLKLRLTLTKPGPARIREIAVYESKDAMVGTGVKGKELPTAAVDRTKHQIAVNQIGYETGKPKRFTAPLSADRTEFSLRAANAPAILHQGEIRGGVGDFSAFRPTDSTARYVIEVRGSALKDGASDPFLIRGNLYQEQFWQAAVDFLNDSRAVVATHPSAYGGCPWRDGTYYDAIIPSLVLFYLADQKAIDAMPRQIDWAAEKARVLNPNFKFDAKNPCNEGVMDAVRNYYQLEPPKVDAPDVVKLIHWGAGYYLVNPATRDPSGDPDKRRIHAQTVEQVAYVVWAWPVLKHWLPESFYVKCRDFCFANWQPSLEISKWWDSKTYISFNDQSEKNPMGGLLHPFKGRHAPGHSIVPNLLMHEVAKREGRADAGIYLDAAVAQADWCVKNLDWNHPRTTKGQRMSEHRTIPNLVWLLQKYPQSAPPGLKEKINEWAKVATNRSDNFWDFRRYDLENEWTIPKLNDVGNSLSLPAIALAASWVVDDAKLKQRLEEIATASVDHVFGRNPRLAAAPDHPERGFPEIERGWPKRHPENVCARLELCRGSIASLPGSEMYPFNPSDAYRHAEGWVNYGASWCISLAYFKFDAAAKTTPSPGK
jgi:hypothetical protein